MCNIDPDTDYRTSGFMVVLPLESIEAHSVFCPPETVGWAKQQQFRNGYGISERLGNDKIQ